MQNKNYKELLNNIKAFAFDVDGVLTDGMVITDAKGEQLRAMKVKDGLAMQMAIQKGYPLAIISGGASAGVEKRLAFLGIKELYLGVNNKQEAFEAFRDKNKLQNDQILYMGDDLPDLEVLKNCGLATCPSDAAIEVKSICSYISPLKGGEGCVRDVLSQVMKVHQNWP